MLASNDTDPSSPEKPLTIPATLHYQDGVHFFRVPDPRGKTLWEIQHEMSDPSVGMAVVVEMRVSHSTSPHRLRWAFRYIWASWSLVVEFGHAETWELVVEKTGPRTEMQVRELYELANDLCFRECVEFLQHKWPEVKTRILPARQKGAELELGTLKRMKDTEEQAVVKLKLAAAKASSGWRKKNDPETIVLQCFLQGRTSPEIVCELFDLDLETCVPFLRGLQDAYDRLISDAVGNRCATIRKFHRMKKITLQEAADLLALDTPTAEDILRIGSFCDRELQPAKQPTNKQLSDALETINSLRQAGRKDESI
jgi:hypothetical protein